MPDVKARKHNLEEKIEYELIDRNYITRNFTSIVRDMIQKHMDMTHGYGTVQHRNKSY